MGNAFIFQSYYSLFEKFRLAFERNQKCKGDFMKNKKNKLFMSFSVLIIGFLLSSSSIDTFNPQALMEDTYDYSTTDSFERLPWKWNLTEIVSTESTEDSSSPSLAIDSADNLHIVWDDLTNYAGSGDDSDIFYKRWDSLTSSWTITEVVSTESSTSGGSYYPSLAVDSVGNIHVAWEGVEVAGTLSDHQIFYKSWNALSQSWSTTVLVSTESSDFSGYPSIAVDHVDNIHIVWEDLSNYAGNGTDKDIFYKRWDDALSSWTVTEVVSTESTEDSSLPSLAVDSLGDVHIVWSDMTDYNGAGSGWDVFYKCLVASSSSWTVTEVVSSEDTSWGNMPSLAIDSIDNVHVTWCDDFDIGYKYLDTTLSTWTTTEIISTESISSSFLPSLAIDSAGNIHVSWSDLSALPDATGPQNIFYKCMVAFSSSWSTTEVLSTEYVTVSTFSSLAVDSIDNIHVTWDDDFGIFYKVRTIPPDTPELATIVPNPTQLNTVYLDWDTISRATSYSVYRSTSYIWSVEELTALAVVTDSEYLDTVPSEGFYYYVVVAENFAGNSSHSNLQTVEVKFPDLEAPELSFVLPNPTETDSVSLVWNDIDGVVEYYVYRSDSYIWSVEGLTPIATVGSSSYIDTLPDEGFYFYVIVANDGVRNSTHSNCEYIQYKLPTLQEFTIVSSLIFGTFVVLFVVMRIRKRKPKPN